MRFKFIKLKDFQRHRNLKIIFSPGITTIVGETDTGKSALVRALKWICTNGTGGSHYRRRGAARARVVLVGKEQGKRVLLIREQGTKNLYRLNGSEFRSFGSKVPDSISKAIRVSSYNFQGQHDPVFWFGLPPGQVSRQLNALVNLSIMDACMSMVGAEVRRAQERVEVSKERLIAVRQQWQSLRKQKQRIKDFRQLEQYNEENEKTQESKRAMDEIISEGYSLRLAASEHRGRYKDLRELGRIAKSLGKLHDEKTSLEDIIQELGETQVYSPPDPASLKESFIRWQKDRSAHTTLKQALHDAIGAKISIRMANDVLVHSSREYKQKTKGKNCPLCRQPLP